MSIVPEFIRTEQNGIEYFTIVATGESGISETGLARLTEIPRRTLGGWLIDLGENRAVKGLEALMGKGLHLGGYYRKKGGQVKIIKAEYAFDFIEFAAFERKSATARTVLKACGAIGLTSYIQGVTGWLPIAPKD